MKIFWAIVVSAIIVFVSALLFSILKISMGSGASFIGLIIIIIGIWLIKYSWTKITYSEEPKESIIDNTQSLAKAVINHSKEFVVQEVKPTINNYIERHNKSDLQSNINEDEIYEQVMIEIEEDNKVKSTWAKALAQSDGDDKKAQSLYIKLRVEFLVQEETFIESDKDTIIKQDILTIENNKERINEETENKEKQLKEDYQNKKDFIYIIKILIGFLLVMSIIYMLSIKV